MLTTALPVPGATRAPPGAPWARWWHDRGRVHDVALMAVAGLGLVFVFLGEDGAAEASAWTWVQAALTLAVVVGSWWRRRHPFLLALLASAVVALGGSSLPLWVALFSLAVRRRDRLLALAVVAALAALLVSSEVALSGGLQALDTALVVAVVLVMSAFVALPVAVGAFVGARRDLVQSRRDRAQRAETEQRLRADQTRLAERTRIAQEMHDVLAHRISLVALHAGALEVNPTAGPADVERSAALIRTTARQAMEDLRAVLGVLRTDTTGDGTDLLPQPTLDDVDRLVRASTEAGVDVHLTADLPTGPAPPLLSARTAYRVVQEGLTNVHKHAAGAPAVVQLSGSPGSGLRVQVGNAPPAAVAAPLVPGAGLGLVGLRERVELAGGSLVAGLQPDGGFVVRADLPWPRSTRGALA